MFRFLRTPNALALGWRVEPSVLAAASAPRLLSRLKRKSLRWCAVEARRVGRRAMLETGSPRFPEWLQEKSVRVMQEEEWSQVDTDEDVESLSESSERLRQRYPERYDFRIERLDQDSRYALSVRHRCGQSRPRPAPTRRRDPGIRKVSMPFQSQIR